MQNRKPQLKKPDLQKLVSGEKTLEFRERIDRFQSNADTLDTELSNFRECPYNYTALEVLGVQSCKKEKIIKNKRSFAVGKAISETTSTHCFKSCEIQQTE